MNDASTAMRAEASACLSSLFLGILARGGVTFGEFEGLAKTPHGHQAAGGWGQRSC